LRAARVDPDLWTAAAKRAALEGAATDTAVIRAALRNYVTASQTSPPSTPKGDRG
jgi:hypothetical protein